MNMVYSQNVEAEEIRFIQIDGLIDVTDKAKEVGYIFPVSITKALWTKINDKKSNYGDMEERLWDVLHMGILAINQKAESELFLKEIRYFLTLPDNMSLVQELKIEVGLNKYFGPWLKIKLIDE